MRQRRIATTLGAIACVIACLTTGLAGAGGGPPGSTAHFATFASSPPTGSTLTVTYGGSCPAGPALWCNATAAPPVVASGVWTDELGFVNPAQAVAGGPYHGSVDDVGAYTTAAVRVGAGGHVANATWTESLAYAGLVSIYASAPCGVVYSGVWLNLTASLSVYNAAGTLLGTTSAAVPIMSAAVNSVGGCANHGYAIAGYSGVTPLGVAFTTAGAATVHLVTAIGLDATIRYTHDSCAIFGANWGVPGGWSWGYPAYCPPIGTLSAPPLPPPPANTGIALASSTIV